jgi:hypothetical protein
MDENDSDSPEHRKERRKKKKEKSHNEDGNSKVFCKFVELIVIFY